MRPSGGGGADLAVTSGGWRLDRGRGRARRCPKWHEGCLYRVRLGLGGFWRGFGPSDLDLAAPDARGGMLDLGGLCRMPWAEKRGMKCGPTRFPETENV